MSKSIYTYDNTFFEKIDTEEKAYILGFIYADGNVNDPSKDKHYRVKIKLKADDFGLLEKIKDAIKYTGPVKIYNQKNGKGVSELRICSKIMHSQLVSHGVVPRKTFVIKYPPIDESLDRHFIRGFFDGDGSIYLRKNRPNGFRVDIQCASYDFLESIVTKIKENTDVDGKINNGRPPLFKYNKDKNSAMKILEWLYKDSKIFLDRKYNLYKAVRVPLMGEIL